MKDHELYPSFRKFGWNAYEDGRFQAARRVADYFLAWSNDDGDAHQLRGLVYYSDSQFHESVAELETASLIQPLKLASQVCLANGYAHIGHSNLACDLLQELAARDTMPVAFTIQIAAGLNLVDRPDLAFRTIQKVIRLGQNCAQAWYDFGYYIGRCGGDDADVEITTRKAILLDPKNPCFRVGLAGLLFRQDRMDEAIEVIDSLTKEAINQIECICCLEKVIELYRRADDGFRTLTAIRQLKKQRGQSAD